MGAIAVLRHVAIDHDVDGAVLLSCPARWRMPRSLTGLAAVALTQTSIGRLIAARHIGVRVEPRLVRAAEPAAVAAGVQVPVAVVHGERDTFIPAVHASELHDALGGARRLVVVPGHGHAFGPAAVQPLCDAVDWVLAT